MANVKYAVVTYSGSFNPVHSSHLAAMTEARRELERQGYTVLGGFIVPSSQGYVDNKLGPQAMPLKTRVAMVEKACQGTLWEALDWGWASSRQIKERVNQYLQNWCRNDLQSPISIATYEVAGADYVATHGQKNYMVCLKRGTDTQAVQRFINMHGKKDNFYLSTADYPQSSSTTVRGLILRGDWGALQKLYAKYPAVLNLMKQLFRQGTLFKGGMKPVPVTVAQGASMPKHQHPKTSAQGNLPGGLSVGEKVYRIRDSLATDFFKKGMVGTVKGVKAGSKDKVMVDYPGRTGDWNSISSIRSVKFLPKCKCGCPVNPPDNFQSYDDCCTECYLNTGHSKQCYDRSG